MKFLDEVGLSYFLDKLKTFIKGKYVGINDPITISGGRDSLIIQENQISLESNKESVFTLDKDGLTLGTCTSKNGGSIYVQDNTGTGSSISASTILIDSNINNYYFSANANTASFEINSNRVLPEGNILTTGLLYDSMDDELSISSNDELTEAKQTSITSTDVQTYKFIKKGGTSSQLLVADGSVAEFNTANGVPKLNASGKIDSSQVDALTNAEIDAIVI